MLNQALGLGLTHGASSLSVDCRRRHIRDFGDLHKWGEKKETVYAPPEQ